MLKFVLILSPLIGFFVYKWIIKNNNLIKHSTTNNSTDTMDLLENEEFVARFHSITLTNYRLNCKTDDGSTTRSKSIMLEQLSSSEFKYQRKTFLTFFAFLFGIGGIIFLQGGQGSEAGLIAFILFVLCILCIVAYYLSRKMYIIFTTSGNEIAVKLENVTQVDVDKFINTVEQCKSKRELVSKHKNPLPADNIETKTFNSDLLEHLEKLGKLRDSGILNEEEFQSQKNKLLR